MRLPVKSHSNNGDRTDRPVDLLKLRADDLRYLLVLARTGRLVVAATVLGVDHTTVSRRIGVLEKSIGVRLVERGVDGWELTDLGRSVANSAAPIEEAIENVAKAASGCAVSSLRGTVRVTAPDGFGALFVSPTLTRVQREHPELSIELITATRELTLHQSGFDLAVAVGTPTSSRLVIEDLASYSLSLYATESYVAEHGAPTSLDSLHEHVLIFYTDSLLRVGDLDLERHVSGASARFSSTNVFAQVEAARAGAGVGVLPDFLAMRYPELMRIPVPEIDIRLDFTLAARRDSASRPVVQVIRHALREEVEQRRSELLP